MSRLTELVQNPSGTSHDLTLGLGYNPASQIATNTRSNDSYAWGGHYAVSRNYTANGLNQYTAAGSITPTYDNRGNLTSAGSITYGYDADNMLISASGGVTLAYDPLQRLYETAGGSTTRLAYDGQSLVAEYNGSNTLLRRYVHGPGTDEPLVWYEGTGTSDRRWLHADERGSVIAVSDGSGAVTNVNAYDESGIPALANAGRFQYTGQIWLPEIGMYHYRARIYSPTFGRFLQTDPIGYGDGMNLYAYVGNDPVNFADPSGLSGVDDWRDKCVDNCGGNPGILVNGPLIIYMGLPASAVIVSTGIASNERGGAQWGHRYPIDRPLTEPDTECTDDQAANAVQNHSVPGSEGSKVSGSNYPVYQWVPTPVGWRRIHAGDVNVTIRNEGHSVVNTTVGDHIFRQGTVELNQYGNQRSGFRVRIFGYGINTSQLMAGANQLFGPFVFRNQIEKMREQLRRECGG